MKAPRTQPGAPDQLDKGLEYVPCCNLCGATEYTVRFPDTLPAHLNGAGWEAFRCTHPGYGIHPPIVTCQKCGLTYTNPRTRIDQIKRNYEMVEDPLYLQERAAREITFRKHLRSFERYTGPARGRRLLDVGAYIGVFVEVALEAGWDAWGIEPSRWASAYAQERNLKVVRCVLGETDFEPESFDALTMWDVIEHLPDPLSDLRHAYKLLKPGGWIAVHTMDIGSLFTRLMGSRWPWLMQMHLYYFNRSSLTALLEKAGFQVVRIRPEGRYLRLRYLTTRLRPYSAWLADRIDQVARFTGLDRVPIPVNFGDLVTAYAYKPADQPPEGRT